MLATSPKIRFTVKEYFRMSEAGVFDDRRVELIEGRIVPMHAQAHRHRWAVSKGSRILQTVFPPEKFWVVVQGTLVLAKFNAPDPDLHVFDIPEGTPENKLPKPFLVIEVSDKTYRKDGGVKLRRYAEAGVANYWIVNIQQRRVEVYRKPENPSGKRRGWQYRDVEHFKPGQKISPLKFEKISIAVSALMP